MRANTSVSARFAATCLLLVIAIPAGARTTGQLAGVVVDNLGAALPGVSVMASSPSQIGGQQLAQTDAQGRFLYPRLAPGLFTVRLALNGFLSLELVEVQVRLDHTTELHVTMSPGMVADEIEVLETTPVVDATQVSLGQTYTSAYLLEASVGRENRDLFDVVGQAAGVDSRAGIRVLGSSASENAFLIDGLETTSPVNGLQSISRFSFFEAIDQIALHSAGFQAEYGLATGGIINLVTKSGGNRFRGSIDYRYSNGNMTSSGEHFDPDEETRSVSDLNLSLGGPISRDRLWFFATLQYLLQENTPSGAPTTFQREGIPFLAKLTWQAAPRWSVTGKAVEDAVDATHFGSSPFTAPEATWRFRPQTRLAQTEALGQLSDRLLLGIRAGIQDGEISLAPNDGDLITIGHINSQTGESYGNALWQEYQQADREEVETDLTWFADSAQAGSHEVKAGLRWSKRDLSVDTCYNGHGVCRAGVESFAFTDSVDEVGGDNLPLLLEVFTGAGRQDFEGTTTSAYIQDSWRLRPGVTLQLGLRWDRSVLHNDVSAEIADLAMPQPRLGVAWDISADGKNVLKASWGRFMHPSTLSVPFWVAEMNGLWTLWLSCSTILGIPQPSVCAAVAESIGSSHRGDPEGWDPAGWVFGRNLQSAPNQTASNLEPMVADELVLGFERELFRRTALEVSYVKKNTRDVFEDTCNSNFPAPAENADCDFKIVANLPNARRDYEGWMLRFESRGHDRVHFLTSYVYSESKGSVESGLGGDFDHYPYHFVNRDGFLSDHSRHTIKVNGYVRLPYDLSLGVGGWWRSEFRWTPIEPVGAPVLSGVTFLEPRGSRKGNSLHNLDLQLMKGFRLGPTRLRLIGTVYNLLDNELVTDVCESVTGCGTEFEMGDAIAWQQPRRFEVGVRIEF